MSKEKKFVKNNRRKKLNKVISFATVIAVGVPAIVAGVPVANAEETSVVNKRNIIDWESKFWGANSALIEKVIQTSDGGYVVVGVADAPNMTGPYRGRGDAVIMKYSTNGTLEWEKYWSGNTSALDAFRAVTELSDGSFVAVGETVRNPIDPYDPNKDIILVKFSPTGEQIWSNKLMGNQRDGAAFVEATSDGGFILFGTSLSTDLGFSLKGSESDIIYAKYDKDGNKKWLKSFGGSGYENLIGVTQTRDKGFILTGYTDSKDIAGIKIKGVNDSFIFK
ncbi:Uncharacterised protein [Lysinibacillus capsici]|uniref:Uncharacterized protein n=1 Tax=Lysinibacillus capsici TaxID=2115968 RepID=A0A2X1A8I7_9BACI|nr:hypothetical protein [Lysinibacillus capsici]SPU40579.1 Uncharacterised protein [Lysinibacillus capsici]